MTRVRREAMVMSTSKNWATRTIRDGRVRIAGREYVAPDDGKFLNSPDETIMLHQTVYGSKQNPRRRLSAANAPATQGVPGPPGIGTATTLPPVPTQGELAPPPNDEEPTK